MTTKSIWKFPFHVSDDVEIAEMPVGAQVLTVAVQNDTPCIWSMVDVDAPREKRRFRLVGTGHPFDSADAERWRYVGSFQLREGRLVFHLFEVPQ